MHHIRPHQLKELPKAIAVLAVLATACLLALAGPPGAMAASDEPTPTSLESDNPSQQTPSEQAPSEEAPVQSDDSLVEVEAPFQSDDSLEVDEPSEGPMAPETLVTSSLLGGVATRPLGSDAYWPPVGTRVAWSLTQPIQDLLDQGRAAGFPNLGTLGNTAHLQRHGDHTPWSYGKLRGRIYAKDTTVPRDFEAWLVAKCKSPYNTLWIDFFNINGRQYNNAGRYLGRSADAHLHISVRRGYENAHVSLFRDYKNSH